MLTVIVPTRNEERNVRPLVERTAAALDGTDWELLFVDDSDDATPEVVAGLGDDRVRLLHRPPDQREGGLAGAVCVGFSAAIGDELLVMDGDLQHDPADILRLREQLAGADVVVASRFADGGGGVGGLDGRYRRLVSNAARFAVRAVFPRIRGVRDPLGGFFAIRRHVLEDAELRPDGFKILLEVLVRGRWRRVHEVPISMSERADGASKASLREGARFGVHLLRLRATRPGAAA
jgi:glycosyltransferase involved in cell wall biosynthesis